MSSFSTRSHRISTISWQGSFPVDQFLYGILQKPAKGLGLLAVDQLLNIPQIHVLFANGKTVTAVYFYLQALWFILGLEIAVIVLLGLLDGAALDMIRWL